MATVGVVVELVVDDAGLGWIVDGNSDFVAAAAAAVDLERAEQD